jgi:ferrochelatase
MRGVLLLNMGGPDSLDAVRPFLFNLFSDREIIRLGPPFLQKPLAALISTIRSRKTRGLYRLIGGKSPLPGITNAQATALASRLAEQGHACNVYVGMSYWHPFIGDTLARMERDGVTEIVVLTLYPQFSQATAGAALGHFKRAAARHAFTSSVVPSWCTHPLYIEALAGKVREGMSHFAAPPLVLFSAHSLPKKLIDEGDPYLDETIKTIEAVARKVPMTWHLSFQSKSGPVQWLAPSTADKLAALGRQGVRELLVVPVSFVSDHIETLYEIDILFKNMASALGITLRRAPSLNTSPRFIDALADLVITHAR